MKLRFLLPVLTAIVAVPALAQPKIEIVGGKKFDFGNIYRGKSVDHKVIVKNAGNQALELGKVDVSCGCTGTIVSNHTILPGKTGEVLVTFNSANFSGKVQKSVTINSNAPDGPTIVSFEGTVIQEIAINPQQFWFRDAEVGKSSFATVTLVNNSKTPITLTNYNSNLTGFSLALPKEPVKPGQSIDIKAEFKAKSAMTVNDGVSIKTSSQNEPDVFVRIFGSVK